MCCKRTFSVHNDNGQYCDRVQKQDRWLSSSEHHHEMNTSPLQLVGSVTSFLHSSLTDFVKDFLALDFIAILCCSFIRFFCFVLFCVLFLSLFV